MVRKMLLTRHLEPRSRQDTKHYGCLCVPVGPLEKGTKMRQSISSLILVEFLQLLYKQLEKQTYNQTTQREDHRGGGRGQNGY